MYGRSLSQGSYSSYPTQQESMQTYQKDQFNARVAATDLSTNDDYVLQCALVNHR